MAGINNEEDLDRELTNITHIMSERGEASGAMLLGQDAFSNNYRFIERFIERYGGSATKMLFSLSSDEEGVIFSEMVSEFGNVLKKTLERSDIVFQWQHNHYFVVLPMFSEKDTSVVVDRIMKAWKETGYYDRMKIKYTTGMIE